MLFTLIGVLIGCGNSEQDIETKKENLEKMKKQLEALEFNITELEREITQMDPSLVEQKGGKLVTTKTAAIKNFKHFIEIQGNAESDENVTISAEIRGEVKKMLVQEGQNVTKGQTLMQLDDEIIRRQIEEIEVNLELATTVFERQQNLWNKNIGSEIQFLEAKNQKNSLETNLVKIKAQLEKTRIKSPISGTVDEVIIKIGEMANPGYPMMRVVNLENIKIKADAPESYIGSVYQGEPVIVTFPALGIEKEATVSSVGKVINPQNRTFRVEIRMPNKDNQLKANLLAVIRIVDYEADSTIVAPTRLIQYGDDKKFLFVVKSEDGEQIARKRIIETGKTYKGETEVKSGLYPDDILIDEGSRDVSEGDQLLIQKQS